MRAKIEFVDVCQPIDKVNHEVKLLQNNGYICVGQSGGGDIGSCLIFEDYANASSNERILIQQKHDSQVKSFKEFWERRIGL